MDDDDIVELTPKPGWDPLGVVPRANAEVAASWLEDDFVPVTPEEMSRRLRETVAMAREKGWIPAEDPGCQCLICRMWRQTVG